jgi:fimbrial isopeptide formation D2 family protein/uncharacterized repeat protein (TIGR01451 family)
LTTVVWDGKDDKGVIVPARALNQPYPARILSRGGEYHFPMLDAENNPKGFTIEMLNPPGPLLAGTTTTTVYFDERNYKVGNTSVNLSCASPIVPVCDARGGVDSAVSGGLAGHVFTGTGASGYGDQKAVDTWAYYPSAVALTDLVITKTQRANVLGTKSVKFLQDNDSTNSVTVGDSVTYTITYSNLGATSDATAFLMNDTLPSSLSFVSAQIKNQTAGNTIVLNSSYAGTGALTTAGTLRKGDTIVIEITAKIKDTNGGQPVANQASATFSTPDNPTVTAGTVVTDATSAIGSSLTPAVGGDVLQTATDTVEGGNNPTLVGDDDPTVFVVLGKGPAPELILLKRITKINGLTTTKAANGTSIDLTAVVAQPDNPLTTRNESSDATNPGWITNYPKGAIDAGMIKSGDLVEYTIYFLSMGGQSVTNANFCDWVPKNTSFVEDSYGVGKGIQLAIGSLLNTFTNVPDGDRGVFYNPTAIPPTTYPNNTIKLNCTTPAGTEGAVVVNLVNNSLTAPENQLPNATASGTPGNSYGFVRFVSQVK